MLPHVPREPIPFDAAREAAELRAYLGDQYDHSRLERYEQQLEDELARVGDEQAFYRASEGYLYNLTAFAMSATKLPYLADLTRIVPAGARVLDFGCGIGSDGLLLLEMGYDVEFADFDNPSTRYLRWRLDSRGLDARVHDLDRGPPPPDFHLAFAFDVIEHVPDPFAFLESMEAAAAVVLVNLLEPKEGETALHHELPIADILARARSRGLVHYRRHHGSSHLVAYGAGVTGRGVAGLRSRLALIAGSRREAVRR
jgi:SAM-dependent methyltransferase